MGCLCFSSDGTIDEVVVETEDGSELSLPSKHGFLAEFGTRVNKKFHDYAPVRYLPREINVVWRWRHRSAATPCISVLMDAVLLLRWP